LHQALTQGHHILPSDSRKTVTHSVAMPHEGLEEQGFEQSPISSNSIALCESTVSAIEAKLSVPSGSDKAQGTPAADA